MPPRIADNRRQAILADIQAGKPRNAIAREHNVAASTVSNIADEANLNGVFDRAHTENATRARVADMRAQRAAIAADLLSDVQRLRTRAWSTYRVPMSAGGRDGGVELIELDMPPLSEVRNAYTSIGIILDKHLLLTRNDDDTADGAKSMLGALAAGLQVAYERIQAEGAPSDG